MCRRHPLLVTSYSGTTYCMYLLGRSTCLLSTCQVARVPITVANERPGKASVPYLGGR